MANKPVDMSKLKQVLRLYKNGDMSNRKIAETVAAEDAAIIYTFMGCCKLAQVDVRKWLNYFFTHIHDYDEDYSRDLLEVLLVQG